MTVSFTTAHRWPALRPTGAPGLSASRQCGDLVEPDTGGRHPRREPPDPRPLHFSRWAAPG